MTALEKIQDWIKTFPQYDALTTFSVDYTSAEPTNGGLMPAGLVEVSRTTDIVGNVTVSNQYNFTLYFVFLKSPGDETTAEENAQWLMDFQDWVQAQSVAGKAPMFGDDARQETTKAQNGMLLEADAEGTAVYSVNLSANFVKKYEVENKWLT